MRKPKVAELNIKEMEAHADEAVQLLKSMCNRNRLMVLCLLSKNELSVGELHVELNISQSALSQHLAVLREHKLVETRREAQTIYYRLGDPATASIIEVLAELYCQK